MNEQELRRGESFADWKQKVGVEREFKWSFTTPPSMRDGRTTEQVLLELPLPHGFARREPYSHVQNLVYLDSDWRLTTSEKSLTVVLNEGPSGRLTWIKSKQTVSWHGLRRDALEIAERIETAELTRAVGDGAALPVRQLTAQFEQGLRWQPFATSEQQRWKMNVVPTSGASLTVSWDECLLTTIGTGRRQAVVHCVEVETSMLSEPSAHELGLLADAVAGYLGASPTRLSKSHRAAEMCGWR